MVVSTDRLKRSRSPAESLTTSKVSKAGSYSSTRRRGRMRSGSASSTPRRPSMASAGQRTSVHIGELLNIPKTPSNYSPSSRNGQTPSPISIASPVDSLLSENSREPRPAFLQRSVSQSRRAVVNEDEEQTIGLVATELSIASPRSITVMMQMPQSPLDHFEKWFPESPTNVPEVPEIPEHHLPRVNKVLPQPPYHVFDRWKKRQLVVLVSFAGILSPLSTSVFFPALPAIMKEFEVSTTVVMLLVTAYMAVQGIGPFFWMPLCSVFGRRPIFIVTLLIFTLSNIGLLLCQSFTVLLVLRILQSFGTAALTATCAAVIGDISTSKERNTFIGTFGGILMFTFISPVIGAVLTYYLGFRSIFWLLLAFGATVLILVILILPETLRSIAGNGTIRLSRIQQPLINVVSSSKDTPYNPDSNEAIAPFRVLTMKCFMEPFQCLLQKEVLITAFFGSVVFAICSTVIAMTSLMFEVNYPIRYYCLGLLFLPAGAGSVLSFFSIGYLIDRDFRVTQEHYRTMHRLEKDIPLDYKTLPDFPIERARLRNMWWITLIFIAATACYGYSFAFNPQSMALPLVLQFLITSSATAMLLINGILIADLYKGTGSVTTAVNFMRFMVGAVMVGTIEPAFNKLGFGITFLILAMGILALAPIMLVQWFFGKPWKAKRISTWPRQRLVRLPDIRRSVSNMRLPGFGGAVSGVKESIGKKWQRS